MESRVNSKDFDDDQRASNSPGSSEDLWNGGPNVSKTQPFIPTPTSQPINSERSESNLGNQSTGPAHSLNPSSDINALVSGGHNDLSIVQSQPAIPASAQPSGKTILLSSQSAPRFNQGAPPTSHSCQHAPLSHASGDTPRTSGDARPLVRREGTLVIPNGPILSRPPPSILPSTSEPIRSRFQEDVQFDGLEDQSPAFNNHRPVIDRQLPPLPADGTESLRPLPQARTTVRGSNDRGSTHLDWIVPVRDKASRKTTVGERLEPTLTKAHIERHRFALKARMTGWAINVAIFLQVVIGSLTTGVSAAAPDGRQAAIVTTVLGALSTVVASFLARARGSNEPEFSVSRVKDLEQFIREVDAFQMDYGDSTSNEYDDRVHKFRTRFEDLLGNMTNQSAPKAQASNPGASNA